MGPPSRTGGESTTGVVQARGPYSLQHKFPHGVSSVLFVFIQELSRRPWLLGSKTAVRCCEGCTAVASRGDLPRPGDEIIKNNVLC